MKRREIAKAQEKEVMHNAMLIIHWPIPSLSLTSEQWLLSSFPQFVHWDWPSMYGMDYPFSQFRSAILAMLLPGFLCTCSLAEHRTQKCPWRRVSTTHQLLTYQWVTNTILILNSNPTLLSSKNKFNSIPAKTRTPREKILSLLIEYFYLLKIYLYSLAFVIYLGV